MSQFPNPYESPAAAFAQPPSDVAGGTLGNSRVLNILMQTRPWVVFLSILGFIGAGLFVVLGLVVLSGAMANEIPVPPSFGVIYLVMSFFYVIPSVFLFQYGKRIREFGYSPDMDALEQALKAQKSFWRFVGITLAVILTIYAVIFVFAFIFGVLLAGAR